MAEPQWSVINGSSLGTLQERQTIVIDLPLVDTDGITTKVISGALPDGLRIENNQIVGTPYNVKNIKTSAFCIRATGDTKIADRTLKLTVDGYDEPVWITAEGDLPVGPNGVYFILDSSPIDFQLEAIDLDVAAGETLEYILGDGSTSGQNTLPPGLSMNSAGRISGVVDPLRALDINEIRLGYDAGRYGTNVFDWGAAADDRIESYYYGDVDLTNVDLVQPPRKLNRRYTFVVTVTDGTAINSRQFTIYVVGDDFTRADNTLMEVSTGVFTADITFERIPIWVTPSDLGKRRANNYTTVFLETVEQPDVSGALVYQKKQRNPGQYKLTATGEITEGYYELSGILPYFPVSKRGPDSLNEQFVADPITTDEFTVVKAESVSELPPGLDLDPATGEIAGIIPYQPAVTKEYNFTVTALRYNEDTGIVTVFGTFYEDMLAGTQTIKIAKLSTDLTDGLDDLAELVGEDVEIEGRNYSILAVNDDNADFDTVTLNRGLDPLYKYNPLVVAEPSGPNDYFYINKLGTADLLFYNGQDIIYSDSEKYTIETINDYVKYTISVDPTNSLELVTNSFDDSSGVSLVDGLENLLKLGDLPAYIVVTTGVAGVYQVEMQVPLTANSSNATYIRDLFHTADSAPINITKNAEYQRVKINNTLQRIYNVGRNISFGAVRGGNFEKSFTKDESNIQEKIKTFTIQILGEIDSVLSWNTPALIGSIKPNRDSLFSVSASSTYASAVLSYTVISGTLPYGMTLATTGEISGRFPSIGTVDNPGLTKIDTQNTTFDGNTQTFDRAFKFTVLARDRFANTNITQEFTINIDTLDTNEYSNLYMKPFLPKTQRRTVDQLLNNTTVFTPQSLYRPSDPNFGVQKELRSLIFAGIEQKSISDYVSASVKGVKRKQYYFGDIKRAVAKKPGTDTILYEVIYVEMVDPALPSKGETRDNFISPNSGKAITVDSVAYEPIDDSFSGGAGGVGLSVIRKDNTTFKLDLKTGELTVIKRGGATVNINAIGNISIIKRNGAVNLIPVASTTTVDGLEETWRLRPDWTTIKIDSDAVAVSEGADARTYISNIEKMRANLNAVGETSKDFLPVWMQTAQDGSLSELGYTFAVPLVYTKPGEGTQILANVNNFIKNNTVGFAFNKLDYDIDRYIVNATTESSGDQYIVFGNYQFNS